MTQKKLTLNDILNQPKVINIQDPVYVQTYMGERIVQEYSLIFKRFSWNNKNYDYATFHTVFGALMRFVRFYFGANYEDVRFHVHIFAPTGTGKSRAFSSVFEFASALGLNAKPVNKLSTAGLVGTIESDSKGNSTIIYGDILEQSGIDILGIEEASVLYKKRKSEYEEDILKILQSAMNPYRSKHNYIRKKLAHGEIGGYSYTSYLFATYPPPTIAETITDTGFLQRLFVLYRQYSDAVRRLNEEILIKSLGNKYAILNLNPYYRAIVKKLKVIHDYYYKIAKEDDYGFKYYPMDFTDHSKKTLMLLSRKIEQKYEYSYGSIREQLASFRTRFLINTIKLAVHHAMLRLSTVVEPQDIEYAMKITLPEFDFLMFFIESAFEKNEMDRRDQRAYTKILQTYKELVKAKYDKILQKLNPDNKKKSKILADYNKLKEILTPDEILSLDYWIPLIELENKFAEVMNISHSSSRNWIGKFCLYVNNITDKAKIRRLIDKTPQARFIVASKGAINYIRAIKGTADLPLIIKRPIDKKYPIETPSEYKLEMLETTDLTEYIEEIEGAIMDVIEAKQLKNKDNQFKDIPDDMLIALSDDYDHPPDNTTIISEDEILSEYLNED